MMTLKVALISSIWPLIYAPFSGIALNVDNLSKKWELVGYEIFFLQESPEPQEAHDYLHLFSDLTFESVSEGVYERGKWRLQSQRIHLSQNGESGELVLKIVDLTQDQLTLIIEDAQDEDAQYLHILFKSI